MLRITDDAICGPRLSAGVPRPVAGAKARGLILALVALTAAATSSRVYAFAQTYAQTQAQKHTGTELLRAFVTLRLYGLEERMEPDGRSGTGWPDRSRVLNNLGSYIDKGRYYCLDQVRYNYLDTGQYNLLGSETYFWRQYCYPIWYGFPRSGGLYGFPSGYKVNPFVDSFCLIRMDQDEADGFPAWPTYCNPGDYIDKGWYYSLDQGQYYYLEEGQYNLLGGFGYLLGHPCPAMWYDYQIGDILRALVSADDAGRICITQVTPVYALTFEDCDTNAAVLGPAQEKSPRTQTFTIYNFQLSIVNTVADPNLTEINTIPEPATIAFLALGALTIRRYGKWKPQPARIQKTEVRSQKS